MADVGALRIHIVVENPSGRDRVRNVKSVRVSTQSMLSWIPASALHALRVERSKLMRFRRPSGLVVERWVGGATVRFGAVETIDMVVFGQAGDAVVIGWRTLSGLNLRIDLASNRLVDAGPLSAAAA